MEFIHKTTGWIKGEIFEATIFGSFGFLTIILSLLFWIFGETPNSRAVTIPVALVGLFFLVTAIAGIVSNNKRLKVYTEAYQNNNAAFVISEKKRVEDFQYLYRITIIIAAASFALALGFFLFTNNQVLRAIGLALILFGFAGLFIDYFSKERAALYYKAIIAEIEVLGL